MRRFVSGLSAVALVAGLGLVAIPPAKAAGEISVLAYPLMQPDPRNDMACSQTVLSFTRQDGQPFQEGQYLDIEYSFAYNQKYERLTESWSPPRQPTELVFIQNVTGESQGPLAVPVPFSLCTYHFDSILLEGPIDRVRVRATLSGAGFAPPPIEFDVPIIPWSPETEIVSNVITECDQDTVYGGFDGNLVVDEVKRAKKVGSRARLAGTLFRSGLVAGNDTLKIYKSDFDTGRAGKLVATATTDERGQFEVSVPVGKGDSYKLVTFLAVAPPRGTPIGPVPGPFPEETFSLIFNRAKNGRYEGGAKDWIPEQSQACLNAYAAYSSSAAANDDDGPFPEILLPAAAYAANKYRGAKGKRTYASNNDWMRRTGGQCTISWWERNGRRVSGYTVTCDKRR